MSSNKKTISPLIITINLVLFLILGNVVGLGMTSKAEEASGKKSAESPVAAGTSAEVNSAVSQKCEIELKTYGDAEFGQFQEFLQTHFNNKSSSSSLLDLAMQRYEKFKADILAKYQYILGQAIIEAASKGASSAVLGTRLEKCEALSRQYIEDASKLLTMVILDSSASKKASIYVEKYQQINGKLRALNGDVLRMVTNLSTFEQKIPCYVKSCVSK